MTMKHIKSNRKKPQGKGPSVFNEPPLNLIPPNPGRFDFSQFSFIFAPGSQSSYFISKKAWKNFQLQKLKTVWMQKVSFYLKQDVFFSGEKA